MVSWVQLCVQWWGYSSGAHRSVAYHFVTPGVYEETYARMHWLCVCNQCYEVETSLVFILKVEGVKIIIYLEDQS